MDFKYQYIIKWSRFIFILAFGSILFGGSLEQNEKPMRSIESILNDDGSLHLDANSEGSYHVKGWTLGTDPDGNPRFIKSKDSAHFSNNPPFIAGDEDWEDKFGLAGVDEYVYSLTIDGSGNVYVGGSYRVAGNVAANYIAKWDGSAWSSLGSGMNGNVFAIAVDGDSVYAGGLFTEAGGSTANRVALWNGSDWVSLGSGASNGVNNKVNAIAVIDHDVYVGGNFTAAGGNATIRYIAKWNGSSWSDVGTGVDDKVWAFAVDAHDNLYVGGEFIYTGAGYAGRVAKWNGSSWSDLGPGITNPSSAIVYALGIESDMLYVGGDFNEAGGIENIYDIAQCDTNGENWSGVGGGVGNPVGSAEVRSIFVSGTNVYIGGTFQIAGAIEAKRIAKWNGSSWSALGDGLTSTVYAIIGGGSDIYAGGFFEQAGSVGAIGVAKWNGIGWSSLSTSKSYGINGTIYTITVSGSDVYVGGSFTVTGNVLANNIVRWNGSQWYALGDGVNNIVRDIVVDGSDVYVGGSFSYAGGTAASRIAKWNGSTWSQVGNGFNDLSTVNALAIYNGTLYAGGDFYSSGSTPLNRIAKFSGSSWSALGSGVNDIVYALAFVGDNLYIGGNFTEANGNSSIKYIAKCDANGSSWTALGNGVYGGASPSVQAVDVSGSDVYVGGDFDSAGVDVAVHNIAKWNGSTWTALGNGVNDEVYAIAVSGTDIYVGGAFDSAGVDLSVNYAAKYDEGGWSNFGSGMDNDVHAIARGSLYVGGDFSSAGGIPSYHFAHYLGETQTVLAEIKVFLEGPYYTSGDTMSTALERANYIPSTSPYSDGRSTTVPNDVVDWINVKLRTSATGMAVTAKSAFLHKDGRIVADDGTTGQIMLDVAEGNYYIEIEHRNHLGVMSANPVSLSNTSSTLYDFTTGSAQYYGSGGTKQLESGPEVWGMFSGNANPNSVINLIDYITVRSKFGQSEYLSEDIDLTTAVNLLDYMKTKLNFGNASSVP